MENYTSQPLIRTIDELSMIADTALDELERYYSFYTHGRGRSHIENVRLWEEELCYVQREQGIRANRALAHETWLKEQTDVYEFGSDEDW